MTLPEYFASSLMGNLEMLKMTIADLSDAELMMRPVPGANHANWQLGHLVCAEAGIMKACGASMPELPAGFHDRYMAKGACAIDDPAHFAKKADILALLEKVRAASSKFAATLTNEQLQAKGPLPFTPTVADAVGLASVHVGMHMGQIQVLRRKLGKPILF